MTLMFSCANCASEIEQDSFYCDQCGREILICPDCKRPATGTFCEEHGTELVSVRTLIQSTQQPDNKTINQSQNNIPGRLEQYHSSTAPQNTASSLELINRDLKITLAITPDSILGRTQGPFASQLASLSTISGRHLQFHYDEQQGWSFKDLGSTNKTKYAAENNNWEAQSPVTPNTNISISNNGFIRIANIVFEVNIINNNHSAGTIRTL